MHFFFDILPTISQATFNVTEMMSACCQAAMYSAPADLGYITVQRRRTPEQLSQICRPKAVRQETTPPWSEQPGMPRVKSGHPRCVGWPLKVRSRFAQPRGARPPRRRQDSAPCSRSWSDQAKSGWRECFLSPCISSTPSCVGESGFHTPQSAEQSRSPIRRLTARNAWCSCGVSNRPGSGTHSPRSSLQVVRAKPEGSLSRRW